MDLENEKKILQQFGVKQLQFDEKQEKNIEVNILGKQEKLNILGCGLYNKSQKPTERFFLKVNINRNVNKELIIIMLNPSEKETEKEAKNIFIDRTITNTIKLAYKYGYYTLNILNLITTLEPNSKKINLDQITDTNINFIKEYINKNCNHKILVAWGEKGKNRTQNEKLKNLIYFLKAKKNTYTFCPNKKNFPKHPARIDFDCCKNCTNTKDLFEYKF